MTNRDPNSIVTKRGALVKVGQVWDDMDPRSKGRSLEILEIFHADRIAFVKTSAGVKTRIKIDRLHPNATGYRLRDPAPQE
ncbi:MAG: hypothetical protein A2579_12370 [Lysobacterales bacterium RIFOXYD1_FULL_69_11]|nr:MAG: hypothetical protein A2579_12370 [Xanthomonadales bacterium RIFOXYD1_FULL_69_11]